MDSFQSLIEDHIVAELGHRRAFFGREDEAYLYRCDTTPCVWTPLDGVRAARTVVFSPRGDRAALGWTGGAGSGKPVLDPRIPAVAYSLDSLSITREPAFSLSGDTLYYFAAGPSGAPGPHLVAVDAGSGELLGSVGFSAPADSGPGWGAALAVDPIDPWIYVSRYTHVGPGPLDMRAGLVVIDRRTLTVAGTARSRNGPGYPGSAVDRIVPMPGAQTVYVVITDHQWGIRGSRARILRYARAPSSAAP